MKYLLLLLGKFITKILQLSNRRGTTLPGKVVSTISKKFPSKFKINGKVILVTGTNGKTSTANLISKILQDQGYKVINNAKGANLLSGISSILIKHSSINMNVDVDYAVFEVDESTMNSITQQIDADFLVITNFFRDQLDRHFEISQVMRKVKDSIKENTKLIINADDALTYQLVEDLPNEKVYYSMDESKYSTTQEPLVREARYCTHCKNKLIYDYFNYGHFGNYHCSSCDFSRPQSKYIISDVNLKKKNFTINSQHYKMQSQELYTVYNFAMGIVLANELNLKIKRVKQSVEQFVLNNSRMETFLINGKNVKLNIVKNQIGFDATVEAFLNDKGKKTFIYILNNNYADSIDTSWIWDCNYEMLKNNNIAEFICLGMRKYELATRLQLENVDFKITIGETNKKVLDSLSEYEGNIYLISAYTAHMATSEYLKALEKKNG